MGSTKYAPGISSVIGILCRPLDIIAFDACRRQGLLVAMRAGKELRWKPILVINKVLFVIIIHECYGNFLK